MIHIEPLTLTRNNIMELMTDKGVYVIKPTLCGDEYRMVKVDECSVGDLLSEKNSVIRITEY